MQFLKYKKNYSNSIALILKFLVNGKLKSFRYIVHAHADEVARLKFKRNIIILIIVDNDHNPY